MLGAWVEEQLLARNQLTHDVFAREAAHLAVVASEMSERFLRAGRVFAFGKGPYATDAQHVAVEFVHPVIVGKRALPALDVSPAFKPWLTAMVTAADMVMGFAPPQGDPEIEAALAQASTKGALTFALTGSAADYALALPEVQPFIQQEIVEVLYHTLWESVHVFFEHHELGHEVGASGFLYPFLGASKQDTSVVLSEVASSIRAKAQEDVRLRTAVAKDSSATIAAAIEAMQQRLARGGKVMSLGNGGSATDANDFTLDCLMPPEGWTSRAAISLAMESANISAIANDVGSDVVFLRQLIAQAQQGDVVLAFSTSGSSSNIQLCLQEARKRGLLTIALLGNDGGDIARNALADICMVVPCDYIPRIQEIQASMYHVLREGLEVSHG
jgi:D-sedoheptulose 7-phosphate isomerase